MAIWAWVKEGKVLSSTGHMSGSISSNKMENEVQPRAETCEWVRG